MTQQTVIAEIAEPTEWKGWAWPNELTVQWESNDAQFEAKGRMTANGPRIESITILGDDIGTEHLREPVLSRFRAGFSHAIAHPLDGTISVSLAPGGRPPDPEAAKNRLEAVVAAYHSVGHGQKQEAVANALGVSKGYARRLVWMARRAGLLS